MILLNKYINPSCTQSYKLNIANSIYLLDEDNETYYDIAKTVKLSPKITIGFNFLLVEKKIIIAPNVVIEFTRRRTNFLEIYKACARELYTLALDALHEEEIDSMVKYYRDVNSATAHAGDPMDWSE